MKRILFFAKHEKQINSNANVINFKHSIQTNSDFSTELDLMTKVFIAKGWKCIWSCIEWIDINNKTIKFFNPQLNEYDTINANKLSEVLGVIVFRIIGSVEGNRDNIINIIDFLSEYFDGLIINHPKTMKYGITKQYLLELQSRNFPVIETKYFEKTISYKDITKYVDVRNAHIIKPFTGELSNSLAVICDKENIFDVRNSKIEDGENYLRRKELFVGGWLLQPLIDDIWEGEYQLVFFNNTFSHGCKKEYVRTSSEMIVPSQKMRNILPYEPNCEEIRMALSIKNFFEQELKMPIYAFRFDFIKQKKNKIKILEFEILNHGFFIVYIEDNKIKKNICELFENEILKLM